jgi:aminoglycoside phosphotransferase (APT) family kinase protein
VEAAAARWSKASSKSSGKVRFFFATGRVTWIVIWDMKK